MKAKDLKVGQKFSQGGNIWQVTGFNWRTRSRKIDVRLIAGPLASESARFGGRDPLTITNWQALNPNTNVKPL